MTFTCTSTGGNPTPTVEFYQGATLVQSQVGLTISETFSVTEAMNSLPMKCRAHTLAGDREDSQLVSVFSKNVGFSLLENNELIVNVIRFQQGIYLQTNAFRELEAMIEMFEYGLNVTSVSLSHSNLF